MKEVGHMQGISKRFQWRQVFFDRRDKELIQIINAVSSEDQDLEYTRRQYYAYFHPHGIKEMTESKSLRIAYSMVHLLKSLEVGKTDDRLSALQSLKDEVLDTAGGALPKNTARVLLQIMKEMARIRNDDDKQLKLAHDFRITASGKPLFVRKQLKRYHLLEMPEEWNQITFDDHVHDANTKGRKSSTHLVMDAWIKGIRKLRVIHYNYIESQVAGELFQAARILEIDLRIGIEFSALYHHRYVQLIWDPGGFKDAHEFSRFLEKSPIKALFDKGRAVSVYQQAYVTALLEAFNRVHLSDINRRFEISMTPLSGKAFLGFVGDGQRSTLHLEKFIHQKLLSTLQARARDLMDRFEQVDPEERGRISAWIEKINCLDLEAVVEKYLQPSNNPDIPDPMVVRDDPDTPELLKLSPTELLQCLTAFGHRITLNLTALGAEDVLELLYDCNGMISRLEIFNLKDWTADKTTHIPAISRLQEAINRQNPIALKQLILEMIDARRPKTPAKTPDHDRIVKLNGILHDIGGLLAMYKGRAIKARIGSDSTGRISRTHGMGLAVVETLPKRARRQIVREAGAGRKIIPVQMTAYRRQTLIPRRQAGKGPVPGPELAVSPSCLHRFGFVRVQEWAVYDDATQMGRPGNVVTLGGINKRIDNGLCRRAPADRGEERRLSWTYLNSNLRNTIKVLIGFVPALATFALTKDWWLLAYGGAFIWFGITGLRNILQSVLGGGGLRRSPLLRWNAYVSWDRIADSLLYTGFSVPLLDYLVKTAVLDRVFNINTDTQPVALYTFMALVNGIYISSHNAFRGLPKGAIFGNFFRSVLSIPLAVLMNFFLVNILTAMGVVGVNFILQRWAAIISKAASDTVAGMIEGTADRFNNIRSRMRAYTQKLHLMLNIYAQLEMRLPEYPVAELLDHPSQFREKADAETRDMEKILAIHALDLLYFYMYQPRSRSAMVQLMAVISEEERNVFITSQLTLRQMKDISQMFIDGMLGKDFAKALSFYLARYSDYLKMLEKLA